MSIQWSRDDPKPPMSGWYATLHCWEPREGFFPGAALLGWRKLADDNDPDL